MRILVAFPGHSASTIDVATGYAGALKRLGHTVQSYNYEARLSFYAEALKHWECLNPDFAATAGRNLVLASEPIAIEAIDFVPDVALIVCGLVLHRRGYELLHRLGIPMALILTESPYLDREQAEIIQYGHIAMTFTNDRSSVLPLRESTRKRVEYLPHSFDPARHYPQVVGPEYQSDVFFFGTWWPERRRLFERLSEIRNGYHFNLDGCGPITDDGELHLLDNSELAKQYSGSRINLNHHRTICRSDEDWKEVHVANAYSLGPRAYEIAACGAFQLSDDARPELAEVFGDSVATYHDGDDLVAKVQYYLGRASERADMAAEAHARVQSCSFDRRAAEILLPRLAEVLKKGA